MSGKDAALESVLEAQGQNKGEAVVEDGAAVIGGTVVENQQQGAAPQNEEDKKFASKFAALARKEKIARQKEQALAAKEKELEARLKELEEKLNAKPAEAPKKPIEDRLFDNPFETLAEVGLDYETLTKTALNDGKLPVEVQMKRMQQQMQREFDAKLEAIQRSLQEKEEMTKKEREEAARRQEEAQQSELLNNFKLDIQKVIEARADDLQLVAQEGQDGVEAIYAEIAADAQRQREELGEGFEDEIKLMSIEEAASKVEERLLEKAKTYAKLSKIQGLLGAQKTEESTKNKQEKTQTTLSNQQSQVQGPVKRHLSDEEALREAARLLKFQAD